MTSLVSPSEGVGKLLPIDVRVFEECGKTGEKVKAKTDACFLLVNVKSQSLHLFEKQKWVCSYPVSTAKNGVGQEEGTGKTPLGWHYVQEKIGAEADPLAVFESRVATGKIAELNSEKSWIVGRILRLGGFEEGFNRGKNADGKVVDSFARYIYIHGTNALANLGKPVSEGCVRVGPKEMVSLFDRTVLGASVFIF
jgi:hypothetical protein